MRMVRPRTEAAERCATIGENKGASCRQRMHTGPRHGSQNPQGNARCKFARRRVSVIWKREPSPSRCGVNPSLMVSSLTGVNLHRFACGSHRRQPRRGASEGQNTAAVQGGPEWCPRTFGIATKTHLGKGGGRRLDALRELFLHPSLRHSRLSLLHRHVLIPVPARD
jgi:hypothetical protein